MKNQGGFTLLEMIVILIIMGLVAAVTTPLVFKSLASAQLKTSTRSLAAVLRKARDVAISNKISTHVNVGLESGEYRITGQNSKNAKNKPPSRRFKEHKLPENVSFVKVVNGEDEITEGTYTFSFYPKGSSSGGEVFIRKGDNSWGLKVVVNPILGKVEIEEFDSSEE